MSLNLTCFSPQSYQHVYSVYHYQIFQLTKYKLLKKGRVGTFNEIIDVWKPHFHVVSICCK